MIYHIADKSEWQEALNTGFYQHPSLKSEGFIHACLDSQLASVRDRYYAGQTDLLVLHIDESLLNAPIRYELSPSVKEEFPHIFGPVNTVAVLKTEII